MLMPDRIPELKAALPPISSCTALKKESDTSECGACPVCGGKDRFVRKIDSGRAWCRNCRPEDQSMDVIDFHCWLYGKTVADLMREYLPAPTHTPPQRTPQELFSKRGLAETAIKVLLDARDISGTNYAGKQCVAVPFKTLQGETRATQYFSIDQEPFSFTVKNGKPANKVFGKGSKPGDDCFFIAGPMPEKAKEIIFCESVINAMTAYQWFPDACCIALGGSTYVRKIKSLVEHIKRMNRVVIAQDNDQAGQSMAYKIRDIIVKPAGSDEIKGLMESTMAADKVRCLAWKPDDAPGLDINDLLQAGQDERGRELINNAVPVSQGKPKIEIISLAQILELDPQLEPIAEGIINRREPVIIHAAGGTGKSTLAHQIAEELARATNMYGNMLLDTFPIRQAGCQSVFIQSENSMAAVNAKSRGFDRETAGRIWYPKIYDDIITTGGAFEDDAFVQRVIDIIHAIEDQTGSKVDLLFVDPLISFNRAEENGAGDMRAALDGITQVMQQTEVTPIVLHHDRKEGDDYRGSTAINDWCRCRVHLKQKFIGEDRITDLDPENQPIMRTARIPAIEMVHTKANNMPLFESFTMVLNKKLKFVKVDDPMDPDTKEHGLAVKQALSDMGGFAESNRALARAVSELTGKGLSTCRGYVAKAVDHKFITRQPGKSGNGKADAYTYILSE